MTSSKGMFCAEAAPAGPMAAATRAVNRSARSDQPDLTEQERGGIQYPEAEA